MNRKRELINDETFNEMHDELVDLGNEYRSLILKLQKLTFNESLPVLDRMKAIASRLMVFAVFIRVQHEFLPHLEESFLPFMKKSVLEATERLLKNATLNEN